MEINISKSTLRETDKFEDQTWEKYDMEHYGKPVGFAEKNFVFKAENKGKIVGSTYGHFECGVTTIYGLVVDKKYIHQGIGSKLLKEIEKWSKEIGAHKIILYTGKNWDSRKFYEAFGYETIAELPDHYFHTDFVLYSKFI